MSISTSIHGNSTYINFEFSFFTLPMLLILLPFVYMPVTILIIIRIFYKLRIALKERNPNVHLFAAISMSQFMCLLFFLCDFIMLRLPATGIVTSWCASVKPNRYINAIYTFTFYVNYATMIFPFLVSTMRIVLIWFPRSHKEINSKIFKYAIPFIIIYPLPSTFFLFPAIGYCYQPQYPYPFGSAMIGFLESLWEIRNAFFLLGNTAFWASASAVNNIILIVKLIKVKMTLSSHQTSHVSHKGEVSLTLTTLVMIFSYVSNTLMVICAQLMPSFTFYAIMLRPFGNDLETVVVAWVFYLTHPVFRKKRRQSMVNPQLINQMKH